MYTGKPIFVEQFCVGVSGNTKFCTVKIYLPTFMEKTMLNISTGKFCETHEFGSSVAKSFPFLIPTDVNL